MPKARKLSGVRAGKTAKGKPYYGGWHGKGWSALKNSGKPARKKVRRVI